jgi:hypothetical protein
VLCQHSTARRCGSAFDSKYLVGDTLAARCGAGVRVELVDPATGAGFEGDLPEVSLEVVVLDGNAFSARYQGESARWAARGSDGAGDVWEEGARACVRRAPVCSRVPRARLASVCALCVRVQQGEGRAAVVTS